MTDGQDILFDQTGQVLFLDAPEGRPGEVVSVQVFEATDGDDSTGEAATTGSPAIPSGSASLTAAAGSSQANPRSIAVNTPNDFVVGRRFLLVENAAAEWVESAALTANAVIAKHPLQNAYTTNASLFSTRMTQALSTAWVSDTANLSIGGPNPRYRVRWVYDVNGTVYVRDTYFDLVRYAGDYGVLPQDVELLASGWIDRLPVDHRADQGQRLIANAYQGVRVDLHEIWKADEQIANAAIIDELVRYKTISLTEFARFLAGGGDADRLNVANQAYSTRFDALVRLTPKVPTRNDSGAAAVVPALPLSRR